MLNILCTLFLCCIECLYCVTKSYFLGEIPLITIRTIFIFPLVDLFFLKQIFFFEPMWEGEKSKVDKSTLKGCFCKVMEKLRRHNFRMFFFVFVAIIFF